MPTPTSPLIRADALQALLASPQRDVLVLDCRFQLADPLAGESAWVRGHIPGALYAHLDRDLSSPKTGHNGRHPLPSPEAFAQTMGRWGVGPDTLVVAYDDAGGMFAARLWWMLRWVGHDAVQVLDGGWAAWLAAGGADSTTVATRTPTQVSPAVRTDWRVDAQTVLDGLATPHAQVLIDARAADRFRGENETLDPVGGHIPGARNRFFQLNLQDGHFKPADTLHAEFTALLAGSPLDAVVHQCGSGVTACHNLLAMAVAGLPPTRLYAGSWSEWCSDPSRPVARG